MARRVLAMSCIVMLLAAASVAHAQDHAMTATADAAGAVTLGRFNQRVEQTAAGYQQKYPGVQISRMAIFDVAYPRDAQERARLHGYGVLLVSAASWNRAELPLAKVYLAHGDRAQTNLQLVGSVMRDVPADSVAAKELGPYRQDSFYLLPLDALQDATLECDFKTGRLGFAMGAGLSAPDYGAPLAAGAPPDSAEVTKFLSREYPDFGITVGAGLP
jgi:hypothetical protein